MAPHSRKPPSPVRKIIPGSSYPRIMSIFSKQNPRRDSIKHSGRDSRANQLAVSPFRPSFFISHAARQKKGMSNMAKKIPKG